VDFSLDDSTRERLAALSEWGEKEVRPVGLEADREGRPIPVDHPYFERCLARGEGRTRWRPADAEAAGSRGRS
jgi:acyl-CoA dehydrogenase